MRNKGHTKESKAGWSHGESQRKQNWKGTGQYKGK